MRKPDRQSLLQIVTFVVFIFNTQLTFAASDDENTVNKIFETHGKQNVAKFITHKNSGKITLQKKKSFVSVSGRPDIKFVTAKSVVHDLKSLNIDVNDLKTELDMFVADETKKQQKKELSLSKASSISDDDEIPLSRKLKYQIKTVESKYNESNSDYERNQLKKELSKLQKKYKRAKYNEKHNIPGKSSKSTQNKQKRYRNANYCNNLKSKVKDLTGSVKRHQIFFCKDRKYRAENPGTCGNYKYSKQYSLPDYKDELNRLRRDISKNCG